MTSQTGPTVPAVVGVLDGSTPRLMAPDAPVVRADDLGLSRGDGCFETARVVTGADGASTVDNLDSHLRRLRRSTAALQITIDEAACRALVDAVCRSWREPGEALVKLMVTRGVEGTGRPTVIATVRPNGAESLRQRREGISAITLPRGTASDHFTDAPWLLGGVKLLSYALNMAALREAAGRGADDAIWVSSDGLVLEAPTAAVVWSRGGALHTTADGSTGILASTTVLALFAGAAADGVQTSTGYLPVADVGGVDGLWLASSGRGLAQVVRLDGRDLPVDRELTAGLNAYAGF